MSDTDQAPAPARSLMRSPKGPARLAIRLVFVVAALLMLAGAGLLAHPYYTDLQASRTQQSLATEIQTDQVKEAFVEKQVPVGTPVTRLLIPKIAVDTVVVEGTSQENLMSGAGHYTTTPLPGEPGNVAIAGHRTTYGKPFHDLDKLEPGDRVTLETPIGPYVYEMVEPFDGHANPWIVTPDRTEVIGPTGEDTLTLTTCHPKGSARQRLIARLKLVETPAGT